MVRDRRDVGDDAAVVEDRCDEADVIEVHTAEVAVVAEDAVTRLKLIGAVDGNDARHKVRQRTEVHRLRKRLRHNTQLFVEHRTREVLTRLDVC